MKAQRVLKVSEIRRHIIRIERILRRLKKFEEKYAMSTEEFVEKWNRGEISGTGDMNKIADFMAWGADYEQLLKMLDELVRFVRGS
ncbi:MAG: hypothetical protein ACTSXJ_08410 [Candidatus Baldrarchaeia archaeon]